ncbi:MAG: hypothetical protein KDK70_20470 [Myxococcales bacterium]|nr:hypothetical protein [Myxococcales bacterium]
MPLHAKILAGLLTFNFLLGLYPLLEGANGQAIASLVIRALLLLGFLKGSEGVRTLLLIGAFLSVILGGFGLMLALPLMGKAGSAGVLLVGMATYSTVVGVYMLWALRNAEVQHWMLNRSLGGQLDD